MGAIAHLSRIGRCAMASVSSTGTLLPSNNARRCAPGHFPYITNGTLERSKHQMGRRENLCAPFLSIVEKLQKHK